MRTHLVQPGDCIASIAARHGVGWRAVWSHPRNRELRRQRGAPGVLRPGDLVVIPDTEPGPTVTPGGTHRFRASPPLVTLHLALREEAAPTARGEGEVGAVAYRLEAAGRTTTGTSDGQGVIEVEVVAHAREAQLVLEPDTERERIISLEIGTLDPIETLSGVKQRLRNLGYPMADTTDRADVGLERGLLAFQRDHGLDESGRLDQATRDALGEAHGP